MVHNGIENYLGWKKAERAGRRFRPSDTEVIPQLIGEHYQISEEAVRRLANYKASSFAAIVTGASTVWHDAQRPLVVIGLGDESAWRRRR